MSNQKLTLKKTHDHTGAKNPKLTTVLIHGIASNSHTFDGVLEYLENDSEFDKIRFVTFDLLGAGESYNGDDLEYNYDEQILALDNAISELKLDTPLVLVGHSLGTFIVTRYAATHGDTVHKLILVSPPVFTEEDFENPLFTLGIEMFKNAIGERDPSILETKAFKNSMENIVLDKSNYQVLSRLKTPAILIYGDEDALIASYNMPGLLKDNPEYLHAVKTKGKHGVSPDKFEGIAEALKQILGEI